MLLLDSRDENITTQKFKSNNRLIKSLNELPINSENNQTIKIVSQIHLNLKLIIKLK